ncbi:ABC transporter substrate-binding protein [Brevibacillus massiliensis]|jgi:branched-chain amino acid transport system substrate-binding protein|uniref:ABC transporter substrate-binding protein n=1 Tax=Brevibacillus massiliensis TaxID=1118054 RepID=UPI000551D8C5|nr:ABC transporter substrate-binding protein [Brevibacillus massiliensis]
MMTLLAAFSLIAGVLTGCGNSSGGSGGDTLKIGLAAPLSGASAQDGQAIKKGAELAVKLANDAGGVNGKKIELVAEDDKTDPKEAAIVANKLATDSSILAVVGHFNSSATLAGAPIYNKNKVVEISPGSSSPAVTDAGPYTFRVITTDAYQGEYVAKWTAEEGFKKVAVIYENTDYGLGLADVYKKAVEANGGQVVAMESYILGQTKDFSPILTKIKQQNPDLLFVGGLYNEAALIAKQSKTLGLNVPFMGVDALYSNALIDLGGDAVEGFMLPGFFNSSSEKENVKAFVKSYEEAYKESPSTYAAYAFDATQILIKAMKEKGADRQSIADYLTTLKGYEGVTGVHDFDENGDVMKEPEKLIVKDGKFQSYTK